MDDELYLAYQEVMARWFNTKLSEEQFVTFITECDAGKHVLNPFQLCAWVYKKPVKEITDRYFERKEEVE